MDARKTNISDGYRQPESTHATGVTRQSLVKDDVAQRPLDCKPRNGSCLQYSGWLLQWHDTLRTLAISV